MGKARQTEEERIKVTVKLPRELVKACKVLAIERDVDLQDLIADALRAALAKGRAK